MKASHLLTGALVCAAMAVTAGSLNGSEAVRAALANSSGTWSLQRGTTDLLRPASEIAEILPGDVISTREEGVRLQTVSGDSMLLGDGALLSVESPTALRLDRGRAALAFKAESPLRPSVKDLDIVPLGGTQSDEGQPILLAAILDDSHVLMRSISHSFAVRSAGALTPLATLSTGDVFMFTNSSSGWAVSAASGSMPFTGSEVLTVGALTETAEKTIVPLWWFSNEAAVIGGLGLVAGGVLLWDELDDDGGGGGGGDDDDFFFPPPSSPLGPGGPDGPGGPGGNSITRFF